ncbi:MAG: copper chaperone PCu(A)C [Chloroflexi bacterium]|nr:copper chaperone PCu(A)C [Chloroflexota bacterium]
MKKLVFSVGLLLLAIQVPFVSAHANLSRSDPAANASLDTAPVEIRLWFTEPLEAEFSRFMLIDSSGAVIETPESQLDPTDPTQLFMRPGELAQGLYTVSWRVLSTDGHTTEGSFAFGIGVAVTPTATAPTISEAIPADSMLIRWINLLSLSLGIGSLAFWIFVWKPAVPQGQPDVERWMRRIIWSGWVLMGLAGIFMLLLQVAVAAGISVLDAVTNPALSAVLSGSRYGQVWLARLVLWLGLGGVLWLARREPWLYWVALILGCLMLLTNSLYSHASAMQQDTFLAIVSDWLHLTATALWMGGLIQFFVVIGTAKRQLGSITALLGDLVGHFSNFARVTVAALMISGMYAAWLQVGSVEALVTTVYGQALFIKLVLVAPLLAISAVNLVFTQRGLRNGESVWAGRLRGLVGAEITLTIAVLAAVGAMTAIAPARTVMAVRNAGTVETVQPYFQMQITSTLMAHLEIMPGYVGENTFRITLYDTEGNPVIDASRIRLRFDHAEQAIGQSELRPELQADGSYAITGANLSIPGTWEIRMTVQRPGAFDTLMDFEATVDSAPPPITPVIDTSIPLTSQWTASLVTGLALLGVGGFFVGQYGLRPLTAPTLAALVMTAAGLVFLISVVSTMNAVAASRSGQLAVRDAWTRPVAQGMTGGVYLTIENGTHRDDRLIAVTSDVAETVEIHQTQIDNNIARMQFFTGLDIPAGGSLTIAPGHYHLMLVNVQRELSVGDRITTVLHFASGTQLLVQVPVQFDAETPP